MGRLMPAKIKIAAKALWGKVTSAFAILALLSVSVVETANATVSSEMNNYFNSTGVAANVTGPSAYNGQSAGYYSLGNVWTRFPQRSVQPFNLQLPHARAGCGGIDLFAGSFSFINSAELVALLKATANNAVGFAFKLAIDAVSPQISKVMEELSQKAQQLNQMNISSCELAKSLVLDTKSAIEGGRSNFCMTLGNFSGVFSDFAKSRQECNNGDKTNSTLAGVTDPLMKDHIPGEKANFAWDVISKSPKFSGFDQSFKEFIMTIVGTVTTVPSTTNGEGPTVNYFKPGGEALFTALLDGSSLVGQVNVLKCDEPVKCVAPTETPLTVLQASALRPRIKGLIQNISNAIHNDTAIGNPEKSLLNITSIPLYKILAVQEAAHFNFGDGEVDTLSEIAAIDLLQEMLRHLVDQFESSTASVKNADPTTLASWRVQVADVGKAISERGFRIKDRVDVTMRVIDRSVALESTLQNAMSPGMSAALNFSRGLNAQGLQ